MKPVNIDCFVTVVSPLSGEELGEDKPASPSKSDTLRSTDSASGGETLEERSSKEVRAAIMRNKLGCTCRSILSFAER